MDADHALLTRFSAVLDPGAPPPTEDWLFYRLGFFVDACLPSVLSQQGAAPFTWLVLLDDRCSDDFRAEVTRLSEGAFTPVWTHEPWRRETFAHLLPPSPRPHLITTRLDSDDAIAVDFMARVQHQPAGQDRLFVNFPRGVQIERSGAVHRTNVLSSPFLSLIEARRPGQPPLTVYAAKHARARGHAPLREVAAPVMWAQVLHGNNLLNTSTGVRVHPRVLAERFRLDLAHDADIAPAALLRGRAHQLARLARLWAAHPGELTKQLEATAWTLRGTHDRPMAPGAPRLNDHLLAGVQRLRRTR